MLRGMLYEGRGRFTTKLRKFEEWSNRPLGGGGGRKQEDGVEEHRK